MPSVNLARQLLQPQHPVIREQRQHYCQTQRVEQTSAVTVIAQDVHEQLVDRRCMPTGSHVMPAVLRPWLCRHQVRATQLRS